MASVEQTAAFYIITIFAICEVQVNCFVFRTPKIEALSPTAIKISMEVPDEAIGNYSYFGFHGNINKPIKITDDGHISFFDFSNIEPLLSRTRIVEIGDRIDIDNIKIGDTVYFWIFMRDFNEDEQIIGNLEFTITEFVGDKSDATTNNLSCGSTKTKVKGQKRVCKNSLIFSEEFSQTSVSDLTQWDKLIQFVNEPDYPFNMYMSDKTISLEDGSLVIKPILTESILPTLFKPLYLSDRCTSKIKSDCKREFQMLPPVITGKITTNRTFSFMYGKIEVRAKLPLGQMIVPEIQLEPTDNVYGDKNYASGLIRIAFNYNFRIEIKENTRRAVLSGPVFRANQLFLNNHTMGYVKRDGGNWDEDFHNYTLIWTPERFLFYVDGERAGETGYIHSFAEDLEDEVEHASKWLTGTNMAPFDQMFHVTLGLRVGGVKEVSRVEIQEHPYINQFEMPDFWKSKEKWYPTWSDGAMKIDYVRVYAL
ncbi:beta-1,3-glucan-binding protein [Helicoverpa armigera]|uniref:beta-1,3-glucan-binding protein n=1 Tax=Helicoverpa armigera TaxID=29058 RepID=UPI003083761A